MVCLLWYAQGRTSRPVVWVDTHDKSGARIRCTALVILAVRLALPDESPQGWHCFCLVHESVPTARGTCDSCPYQVVAGSLYDLLPWTSVCLERLSFQACLATLGALPHVLGPSTRARHTRARFVKGGRPLFVVDLC